MEINIATSLTSSGKKRDGRDTIEGGGAQKKEFKVKSKKSLVVQYRL